MSNIKKVFVDTVVAFVLSLVSTVGLLAGIVVWTNGLGEWIENKTNKLFSRAK